MHIDIIYSKYQRSPRFWTPCLPGNERCEQCLVHHYRVNTVGCEYWTRARHWRETYFPIEDRFLRRSHCCVSTMSPSSELEAKKLITFVGVQFLSSVIFHLGRPILRASSKSQSRNYRSFPTTFWSLKFYIGFARCFLSSWVEIYQGLGVRFLSSFKCHISPWSPDITVLKVLVTSSHRAIGDTRPGFGLCVSHDHWR